jgi:hypothetical protein
MLRKRLWASAVLLTCLLFAPSFVRQAGAADQPSLSKKQVKALIGTASTSADHLKLAQHFSQEADRLEAEAKEHEELAQEYRRNPTAMAMKNPMSARSAEHCKYFAKAARDAAKADRELAGSHEEMAKEAK